MIKENKIKSWKRSQLESDDQQQQNPRRGNIENAEGKMEI